MAWVRIDDGFTDHPKVLKAGPLGMAMQIAALCYCNKNLTDGFVPKQAAVRLLDLSGLAMRMTGGELTGAGEDATWELVVDDLVEAGLWSAADGGWLIHDYLKYQPARADVISNREQTKQRVNKWRGGRNADVTSLQERYNGVCNAAPVPVPVPKESGSSAPASPSPTTGLPKKAGQEAAGRGRRLDLDQLPPDWREWCAQRRTDLDPEEMFEVFKAHWQAQPGNRGLSANWEAAWHKWVLTQRAAPKDADQEGDGGVFIPHGVPAGMRHGTLDERLAYGRSKHGNGLHMGDYRMPLFVPTDWGRSP